MISKRLLKSLLLLSSISIFIFGMYGISRADTQNTKTEVFNLSNGLNVILHNDQNTSYSSIKLLVGAGSATEGRYAGSGVSHFIEHLLFKGTKNRKWDEIAREVELYGGYFNASTSKDTTKYYITVGNDFIIPTLEILADMIINPLFSPEDIKTERDVILKEINMRKDKTTIVINDGFFQEAYKTHPYKYPIIGFKERLLNLSQKNIIDYYSRLYLPENTILIVAGNFDINTIKEKVNEYFSPYENKGFSKINIAKEPKQLGKREKIIYRDVDIGRAIIGYHVPDITNDDVYSLDVLSAILGQGEDSRLFQKIKENKDLAISIGSFNYSLKDSGILFVNAVFDFENEKKVLKAIDEEIKIIKNNPVSKDELEKVKNKVIASYIYNLENIENRAGSLLSSLYYTGNINYYRFYLDKIRSVTEKDVLKVANKYLINDNKTAIVLQSESEKENIVKVKPQPKEVITKKELKNGVVVLFKEDHSLPIVVIRAVMQGGLLAEDKTTNGIFKLITKTMTKSTDDLNQEEIAVKIGTVGGEIGAYSGNNSFGLYIKILKDNLQEGLDLFFDILMNADFPENELKKEEKVISAKIKIQKNNPQEIGKLTLKKKIFMNHPYSMNILGIFDLPKHKSFSREKIIDYYNKFRVGKNLVIGVWGDFDTEEIFAQIGKYIGKLPEGKKFNLNKSIFHLSRDIKEIMPGNENQEQTIVLLGFRGTDIFSEDRYVLNVIETMLSGQGSYLFEKVREKLGAAYYVGAYSLSGLDPGMFVLYAGTEKEKKEEIEKIFFEELDRIKSGKIKKEEIERAKNQIIWSRRKSLEKLSDQSMTVVLDELYGLGYDNNEKVEEIINSITLKQIQDVAKKYFNEKYVLIVVIPEDET
ncbi:M16 family metallopeptidase [Chlamydiota bacterium]